MRSDASGISKVSVRCLVSVRGNDYFSNGQEHRTLVWSIPDASGVNADCGINCQRLVEGWDFYK